MRTISLRVDDIEIGERHRALSDDAVQRLAGSMRDIGLKQPISVRIVEEMVVDGALTAGVPVLVAGAHRLAAAQQLGWAEIDCIEVDDDPIAAELWEIAENLHRCDLSKEQRDEHIRRYAELLVERETRQVPQPAAAVLSDGRKKGPQHEKGIARKVAEATGLSDDTVRRALKPKPPAPKLVYVPDELDDTEVIERQVRALMSAWNKAGAEARERFLIEIDGPVFERTRAA